MGKILTDSQHYNDIANAIRNKGVSGQFKPGQMASAISQIETGADVSGVTASASDVRSGKKFVDANGKTVIGTKTTRNSSDIYFSTLQDGTKKVNVPSGIYDSSHSKIIPKSYEYVSSELQSGDFEIEPYGVMIKVKVYLPNGLDGFSSGSVVGLRLKGNYDVTGGKRINEFFANTYTTQSGLEYYTANVAWFERTDGAKDNFMNDIVEGRSASISDQYIEFLFRHSGFDFQNFILDNGWLTVFNPIS